MSYACGLEIALLALVGWCIAWFKGRRKKA